ncbi:MAG: N-acetylmuramoyl-L-alanine amidase, partial [Syntrophales bacterium]|nr:N-acetylmuramoyl-L-alanine amidase [Syntrophales bacterium]
MAHIKKIFCMLVVWVFGSVGTPCALAANEILNVRHWVAPDHTRVVIDTSEDCEFTVEKERRGLSIDLDETTLSSHVPAVMLLNKPGVDRVMILALPPTGLRVSLSMPEHAQATVFKLNKIEDKPFRIVIDIVLPEIARKQSEARERIKITRKDRIVVIDPGHGGDAPGAVGKRGTLEKDVVLAIAKKLQGILNAKEGYRAFLTRIDDYYVSFQKRLQIAREYGAHLFVSIHADAVKNRNVRGGSVYCLSTSGASSEAARILAQYENLADVVGGVPESEGTEDSGPIILDMFQNHTINQSKVFGNTVLKHLGDVNEIKFTTVQEAPFRVLKLPEIPSVLIETAYISNEKEEKLLRSDRFRGQVASAVAKSVVEFLPPLPLVAEVVSDPKATEKTPEK